MDSKVKSDGLHGGSAYATITNRITAEDMKNIIKSDIDKEDYSTKGYMQAIKNAAKELLKVIVYSSSYGLPSLVQIMRKNFMSKEKSQETLTPVSKSKSQER